MKILDYAVAKKLGIAFSGGAHSLAEKAIAQKLGGGSGGSGGGTYTVTWKNYDGTVLEIDAEVPYGTVPTYNGADPTHTDPDYKWEGGWSPVVGAITGDTTYTAQFKDNSIKYIKLIDRSITEISSNATSIGTYAFQKCQYMTTADFRAATSIGTYAFSSCQKLATADFWAATSINGYAFQYCSALKTLILRSETRCTLGASVFTNTPIASGTGYIYVPRALVDSYKAASGWSTYANQFRAIEDYPDICGGESA